MLFLDCLDEITLLCILIEVLALCLNATVFIVTSYCFYSFVLIAIDFISSCCICIALCSHGVYVGGGVYSKVRLAAIGAE